MPNVVGKYPYKVKATADGGTEFVTKEKTIEVKFIPLPNLDFLTKEQNENETKTKELESNITVEDDEVEEMKIISNEK